MFGDRAKKLHYLDKNGKRTTDIFEARVMTNGKRFPILLHQYKQPELNLPMTISPTWHWRWMMEKDAPEEWKFDYRRVNQLPDVTSLPGEHVIDLPEDITPTGNVFTRFWINGDCVYTNYIWNGATLDHLRTELKDNGFRLNWQDTMEDYPARWEGDMRDIEIHSTIWGKLLTSLKY